jgi:hypothetical protein
MEQEYSNCKGEVFSTQLLTPHNIQLVLAFLDADTIISIIKAGGKGSRGCSPLVSVASVRHFLNNFLNKTDRSIYMPFYA